MCWENARKKADRPARPAEGLGQHNGDMVGRWNAPVKMTLSDGSLALASSFFVSAYTP